jgi:hypothetical protein
MEIPAITRKGNFVDDYQTPILAGNSLGNPCAVGVLRDPMGCQDGQSIGPLQVFVRR